MNRKHDHAFPITRKALLLGCASAAVSASLVYPATGSNKAAPMSADAALAKLKTGNDTFVRYMSQTRQQTIPVRAALVKGQAPFASLLSCADSRTTPEIIFNQGLGDLFVVRVAGNVATSTEKASRARRTACGIPTSVCA